MRQIAGDKLLIHVIKSFRAQVFNSFLFRCIFALEFADMPMEYEKKGKLVVDFDIIIAKG